MTIIISDEEMCKNGLDKFASFVGYIDRKCGFKTKYLSEKRNDLKFETIYFIEPFIE